MRAVRPVLVAVALAGAAAWVVRRLPDPPPPPAAGPVPGEPRLVVPHGGTVRRDAEAPGREHVVVLPCGRSVVGRAPTADVRLQDATVSPEHLEILVRPDGETVIRDLGSLNGVRVNGVPVREAVLVDANRVDLGTAVLVFHRDDDQDDGGRQGGELGEYAES